MRWKRFIKPLIIITAPYNYGQVVNRKMIDLGDVYF
jgi:hypothetical protein